MRLSWQRPFSIFCFFIALPSLVLAQPVIGVAKNAQRVGREITYDFYLENFGTEVLTDLVLVEDLDSVLGAGNYTLLSGPSFESNPGTITLNGSFDGSGMTALINPGSSLNLGATAQIRIVVEVTTVTDQGFGFGVYSNQVSVSAMSGMGGTSDLSDEGTNPDPNGNGDPTDAGEDDPTSVDFLANPIVGLAKYARLNGTQVQLDFYLENFGNRTLINLAIVDDLDLVFGAGNYGVLAAPSFIDDPGTITLNALFDGSSDQNLISNGTLAVADTAQIRILVDVTSLTDQGFGVGIYENQAVASANAGGQMTMDLSGNGIDPDSNENGNPTDPNEDTPTRIVIGEEPVLGLAKAVNISNSSATMDIYLENMGNTNLSQVSVVDDLNATFGAGNYFLSSAPILIDNPGTLTLNAAFDGNFDTQLLSSGISTLTPGDTAQIQFTVQILNLADLGLGLGNYQNQAQSMAMGPGGGLTLDLSDSGTDPDPSGNGDPLEPGENDPTTFSVMPISSIGVAKDWVLTSSGGVPQVFLIFTLTNYGNRTLSSITMSENLNAVYGAGNYNHTTDPEYISGSPTLTYNLAFNGNTNTSMITNGTLAPGDSTVFRIGHLITSVTDQGFGLGIYQNQVTVNSLDPSAAPVADDSTAGRNPDPDGNGDPSENTVTVIDVTGVNAIGIAKDVSVVGGQVTLDFYLENLGTTNLSQLSFFDNLDSVFGAGNYLVSAGPTLIDDPGTLTLDPSFDGTVTNRELLVPATSTLTAGDTAQIQVVVTLLRVENQGLGLGNYSNQVTIVGQTPTGPFVSDLSDFGTNPDPNGNGNGNEAGENDATTFSISITSPVGVAKTAMVADNVVTFDLYLENLGAETLTNLSLVDNLDTAFGAGNYTLTAAPSFIVDPGTLTLNGSFNGGGDTEILAAGSSLNAGAIAQIQWVLSVDVESDQGSGFGVYSNQAIASGTQPSGLVVSDFSDDGIDPDSNGNNDPGEAGENDPTSVIIARTPAIGVAKKATVSGTVVTFDFYIENLGNSTLTNVSLRDPLNPVFGSGNYSILSQPALVNGPGTLSRSPQFFGFNIFDAVILGGFLRPGETEQIRVQISVNNVTDQGNGFGVYLNSVNISATGPDSSMVMDTSDDGIDPDPNGNGNAGDMGEDDATRIIIGDEASLGVAKAAAVVGNQVTFTYTLENLGGSTLNSLSLQEDLDAVFGAGNYAIFSGPTLTLDPGTISFNGGFDGSAAPELLGGGDTLPAFALARFDLVVNVATVSDQGLGFGNYSNQVTGSGLAPMGSFTSDISDNGTDPDPNGNGFPNDANEDNPTNFNVGFTQIGAAKNASVSGNQVTFDFYIENLGTTGLTNVTMSEDLDSIFGAGNYSIVSGPDRISAPRALEANPGFDGSTDTALVIPGSVGLGVTEQFRLVVDVLTLVDNGSGLGVYTNQVTAVSDFSSDLSDNGMDPDPNGDGNPSQPGEDDPTTFAIVVNPVIGAAKTAAVNGRMVTVNAYFEALGNVDLSNLSFVDDLDAVFGAGNYAVLATPSLIDDPGTLVLNTGYDGSAGNSDLLAPGSTLAIGDTAQIRFNLMVTNVTDQGFGTGIYQNQISVSGEAPNGVPTTDLSDSGIEPDPNGNGNPSEAGEDDPTPITLEGDIGDRVYNDLNGNGMDDGEPGLAGVTVFLDTNMNGTLDGGEPSDTTDGSGAYDLINLAAGAYSVEIDPTSVPAGFVLTTGNLPLAVTLGAGEDFDTADFGYQQQDASIGDYVFNDADGDGMDSGGKSGIPGVTVFLDLNTNGMFDGGEPSDTTDGSGAYDITNLPTGTYSVNIDPSSVPAGFVLTTGNVPLNVNLAAGEDFNDADFGYQQQDASIGDLAYRDLNGNGVFDGGEPGQSGIVLYLDLNGNGMFDGGEPNNTSGGGGDYDITNLPTGTYTVRLLASSVPMGFVLTSGNDPQIVNLAAGEDFNDADYGFQQQNATIGDRVFNDLNGNGMDDGEPGLMGVTVYLDLNTNGALDGGEPSAVTDGTGNFDITSLPTGMYSVNIDPSTVPAGYVLITANLPLLVNLAAGEDFNDADFGYQRQDGIIGNFVWNDLNGDGVQDGGEPGFDMVTLDLIDDLNGNGIIDGGEPVIGMTTTAGGGIYSFTGLPVGNYIVNLTDTGNILSAYVQTGGINPQVVSLPKAGLNEDVDFGFQRQDGTLGDFVWDDLNGDGIQDGGEPGIDMVTLDLIDDLNGNGVVDGGEPVLQTQTTMGGGAYDFGSLPVGDYLVLVTDTNNILTNFGLTGGVNPAAVTLVKGEDFNDADFGYQRQDATIGDFVWNDLNGDGIQDGGEPGFDMVTLDLIRDTNGNGMIEAGEPVVQTQTTAGGGAYDFTNLGAGNYLVTVTDTNNVLSAYVLSGGVDPFAVNLLISGDENGADFGFIRQDGMIGDFVWNDLNGDGVQDVGEPGLDMVTLDLIEDTNGNGMIDAGEPVLQTQTTTGGGAYNFINLPVGDYLVTVTDTNGVLTGDILTGGVDPAAVSLAKGQDFDAADFGFQRQDGVIGDLVWHDFDGNSLVDPGEPGLENVTLDLIEDLNGNGSVDAGEPVLDTQTTAVDGSYRFEGLSVGDYIVQVTDTNAILDGFTQTGGSNPLPVTLAKGGEFLDADFGYLDERARIGVAKTAEASTLQIKYIFRVENFGTVVLTDLSMPEDLDSVFGAGVYQVIAGPIVEESNGVNTAGNPGFDGSIDTELFAAGSFLDPGEYVILSITVEITDPPEITNGPISFTNQVTASANGLSGNPVSDDSTDGTAPDPDGNGNPGDNGTTTLVYLPLPVPTLGEWGMLALILSLAILGIWQRRKAGANLGS